MVELRYLKRWLVSGVCTVLLTGTAVAQSQQFDIGSGELKTALDTYAKQSGVQLIYDADAVRGKRSPGVHGELPPDVALTDLLAGTGLEVDRDPSGAVAIRAAKINMSSSLPAVAQAAGANQGAAVEEIIVTAQKRKEQLVEVPIAMTAVTAQTLQTANIQQVSQLSDVVPGLAFQSNNGFVQPEIRGIGAVIGAAAKGTNVGVYVDGFYLPIQLTLDTEFLNVSGVQVLKGPQGTLFGRNTTGGAILITTTDPSLTPRVKGEVSYGSYDAFGLQAYVDTPIGDYVAIDVAALYRSGDNWITNLTTGAKPGNDDKTIRIGAKFFIDDDLTAMIHVSHADIYEPNKALHSVLCCNAAGKPYASTAFFPNVTIATGPDQGTSNIAPLFQSYSTAVQATIKANLEWADLTSYTQYRDESAANNIDLAGSSFPYYNLRYTIYDQVWTQEFLLTSKPGPRLQWTTGLYYFSDENSGAYEAQAGTPGFLNLDRAGAVASCVAGYADLTYQVLDDLFVTGGLRYGRDVYTNAFTTPYALDYRTFLRGFGTIATHFYPSDKSWKATPRAVIRYKPDENSSVYVSFTEGFKAGLHNVGTTTEQAVLPEKILAYEVGYKYSSHRLAFDLDAFFDQYKNLQLANYSPTVSFLSNAPNSRIQGVEGDFRYALDEHFSVNGATGYTLAQFIEYNGAPRYTQCVSLAACGRALGTFAIVPINEQKSQMPFAPKWTANIGARYEIPLMDGTLTFSGILSYTTKEYFDSAQQFANKGHENLDLRLQWVDPSSHYTLAVYGDNVTNSRYQTYITANQISVLTDYNPPPTVGVSFGVDF